MTTVHAIAAFLRRDSSMFVKPIGIFLSASAIAYGIAQFTEQSDPSRNAATARVHMGRMPSSEPRPMAGKESPPTDESRPPRPGRLPTRGSAHPRRGSQIPAFLTERFLHPGARLFWRSGSSLIDRRRVPEPCTALEASSRLGRHCESTELPCIAMPSASTYTAQSSRSTCDRRADPRGNSGFECLRRCTRTHRSPAGPAIKGVPRLPLARQG